jgi:hypothetical protein
VTPATVGELNATIKEVRHPIRLLREAGRCLGVYLM